VRASEWHTDAAGRVWKGNVIFVQFPWEIKGKVYTAQCSKAKNYP